MGPFHNLTFWIINNNAAEVDNDTRKKQSNVSIKNGQWRYTHVLIYIDVFNHHCIPHVLGPHLFASFIIIRKTT